MRLTIGALKGGLAKTTTAVHLAVGLSRTGPTLLVDADPQAASATDWASTAGVDVFPAEVIPWPGPDLAKRVQQVASRYAHIVVDTGGENPDVLAAALAVTGQLLVPVGPSPMELRRLPATFALARRVDALTPVLVRVLLVKVRTGTRSYVETAGLLEAEDFPVMAAQVHLRERYSQAFGSVPADLGEYEAVLAELGEQQ